jgi:hypothetical protein
MNSWTSVDELVRDLGISADPNDPEAVRTAVRRLLTDEHPDRTGGAFSSAEKQERYHQLNAALAYLDERASQQLVRISDVTALVKAVQQAIQPVTERDVKVRTEFQTIVRSDARSRYAASRIGSGVFAAVCAGIITFSGYLKDNPLFAPLLMSPKIYELLFMLLGISSVLFLASWMLEHRDANFAEWLSSQVGIRSILKQVLRSSSLQDGHPQFTFSDVVSAITESRPPRGVFSLFLPPPFWPPRITQTAAEKLAKLHLDDLESRGIARKIEGRRLDTTYGISDDAAAEIRNARI